MRWYTKGGIWTGVAGSWRPQIGSGEGLRRGDLLYRSGRIQSIGRGKCVMLTCRYDELQVLWDRQHEFSACLASYSETTSGLMVGDRDVWSTSSNYIRKSIRPWQNPVEPAHQLQQINFTTTRISCLAFLPLAQSSQLLDRSCHIVISVSHPKFRLLGACHQLCHPRAKSSVSPKACCFASKAQLMRAFRRGPSSVPTAIRLHPRRTTHTSRVSVARIFTHTTHAMSAAQAWLSRLQERNGRHAQTVPWQSTDQRIIRT
jgi:hypothetical protein